MNVHVNDAQVSGWIMLLLYIGVPLLLAMLFCRKTKKEDGRE